MNNKLHLTHTKGSAFELSIDGVKLENVISYRIEYEPHTYPQLTVKLAVNSVDITIEK